MSPPSHTCPGESKRLVGVLAPNTLATSDSASFSQFQLLGIPHTPTLTSR